MSNTSKERTRKLKKHPVYYTWSGRYRMPGTSKTDIFLIIINRWKPLTDVTKSSILGVAAFLHPLSHIAALLP